MTTGVMTEGKMLQRPYSVASAPSVAGTEGYEFFVRHVPILRFTPRCGGCRSGTGCG